jgi:hypothetical protein
LCCSWRAIAATAALAALTRAADQALTAGPWHYVNFNLMALCRPAATAGRSSRRAGRIFSGAAAAE